MQMNKGRYDYGVCIAETGRYAVYEVTDFIEKRGREYKTDDHTPKGGLYLNGKLAAVLDVPINIINKGAADYSIIDFDSEDDLGSLSDNDIKEFNYRICEVLWELSPAESVRVLELLSSVWRCGREGEFIKERSSIHMNWYSMIGILIYNMQRDDRVLEEFAYKYKGSLIAENDWSLYSDNERQAVIEWFENSRYARQMKIVCFPFSRLGFPTLYAFWKGGFY